MATLDDIDETFFLEIKKTDKKQTTALATIFPDVDKQNNRNQQKKVQNI